MKVSLFGIKIMQQTRVLYLEIWITIMSHFFWIHHLIYWVKIYRQYKTTITVAFRIFWTKMEIHIFTQEISEKRTVITLDQNHRFNFDVLI
jgi:hypothetical protein